MVVVVVVVVVVGGLQLRSKHIFYCLIFCIKIKVSIACIPKLTYLTYIHPYVQMYVQMDALDLTTFDFIHEINMGT